MIQVRTPTPRRAGRALLALLAALSLLAPPPALAAPAKSAQAAKAAEPVRGPPTCANAWAMIDFAVARHVSYDRLTPELAVRARDLLATALVTDHPWLLADDVAAIKGRAAGLSGAALLQERSAGRCDHLEAQLARTRQALKRGAELFESADALAEALPAEPPEEEPKSLPEPPHDDAGLRALLLDDALAEAWRVRAVAGWPVAKSFGARRALRWLALARQRLAGRGTADLVNAFAHALDPHTRYETEEEAIRSDHELNPPVGLLGLELGDPVPGGLPITGIHPGSPASRQRALRVGDVLTFVGRSPVADLDAAEVSALLDSFEEAVPLTVARPSGLGLGAPRRFQLVRKVLADRNMSVSTTPRVELGRRVLVARVDEVDQDTAEGLERALRLGRRPPEAVVLDLRGCTGGYLTTSVAIAGLFLTGGPVVRVHRRGSPDEIMSDPAPSRAYAGPVLVLVDEETASGCEIVAGALRARGRALVVGAARTFGKGTMQDIYDGELPTGALYVTTGLFFLPDGSSPQGGGVPVDLVVAPPAEGVASEAALPWALQSPPPAQPMEGGETDRDPTLVDALERLGMTVQPVKRPQRAGTDPALSRASELAARLASERRKR